MTDDLGNALFTRARDQYETATRWSYIAIAILLFFHVITFSPFVSVSKGKAAVAAEIAEVERLKRALDALDADLDLLKRETVQKAKRELDSVLKDLIADFDKLNTRISMVRAFGPEIGGMPMGELRSSPFAQNKVPDRASRVVPSMSEELRQGIAKASSRDDLLELLRPYVEQNLVAPRFARFNDYWVRKVLPRVKERGDAVQDRLRESKQEFGENAAPWDDVEASVLKTLEVARSLKLHAPSDRYWWASREQKGTVIGDRVLELSAGMEQALRESESLRKLIRNVSVTLAKQTKLQSDKAAQLDRLRSQFKEQQAQLSSFVEPLKGVYFDLTIIAPRFPLLLGLTLFAVICWPAARLKDLTRTVGVMARHGSADLPAEWLATRVGDMRYKTAIAVGSRCVLFWAWIAVATAELASWSAVDRDRTILLAAVGGLAVAAATGYRWMVSRGAAELSTSGRAK